jgi:hypothetical protein
MVIHDTIFNTGFDHTTLDSLSFLSSVTVRDDGRSEVENNTTTKSRRLPGTNLLQPSAQIPNLRASITWQFESQTESITPTKFSFTKGTLYVSIDKKVETRIATCSFLFRRSSLVTPKNECHLFVSRHTRHLKEAQKQKLPTS